MTTGFEHIRATRASMIRLLEDVGTVGANVIPQGFNNNIVWHFGHLMSTQQVVCYKFSGLPEPFGSAQIAKYMRGTKPETAVDSAEIQELIELSKITVDRLENDFAAGIFKTFNAFTTPLGYAMTDIDSAIRFIAVHEAIHFGMARTMARIISAQ